MVNWVEILKVTAPFDEEEFMILEDEEGAPPEDCSNPFGPQ